MRPNPYPVSLSKSFIDGLSGSQKAAKKSLIKNFIEDFDCQTIFVGKIKLF